MLRDYTTGYKEDVKVFSGIEIEHTPAYGKQTLFLARNDLTFDQILSLCVASNAEAVYFGAIEHICIIMPCSWHRYISYWTEAIGSQWTIHLNYTN